MSDFNKIPQQQCNVKWHTNHQISVKSINVCNSYSKFSEVNQKHEVSTIDWQGHRDETVKVQKSNVLKFVFKIFSACSNASSTT